MGMTSERLASRALSVADHTIEAVRGRLDERTAGELLEFWRRRRVLDEATAHARLAEVVCVLRDGRGVVVGANSVYAERVDAIGGRPFWVYRSLLESADPDAWAAMVHHAFHTLEAEYRSTAGGPI